MRLFQQPDSLTVMDESDAHTVLSYRGITINWVNTRAMKSQLNSRFGRDVQVYSMMVVSLAIEEMMKPR